MNANKDSTLKGVDINKYIGSKIRYYRKIRDWTQTKLGDGIGVSFQQVQKYEKGVNAVSFPKLVQICDALGISLSDVLGELINDKHVPRGSFGGGHNDGNGNEKSNGFNVNNNYKDNNSGNNFSKNSTFVGASIAKAIDRNVIGQSVVSALTGKKQNVNLKFLFNINCAVMTAVEGFGFNHTLDLLSRTSAFI